MSKYRPNLLHSDSLPIPTLWTGTQTRAINAMSSPSGQLVAERHERRYLWPGLETPV